MRTGAWRVVLAASAGAAAIGVAACGGGGDKSSTSTPSGSSSKAPASAKPGGTLTMAYAGDVDNIDPRITYYQYGMNVAYATQRPLYSYEPDNARTPVPDLASGPPEISADGKTVTVKIREGIKYSPPEQTRVVKTADVKYALESAFDPSGTVPGPYVGAYLGDLHGLKAFKDGKAKHISGIETPDDTTIVFKLDRPRGAIVAGMLSMPASAPVPEEYAKKYDAKNPSTYGEHQLATGPYMVSSYKPAQEIKLVRNPSWDKSTDYKPAYLDSITITEGLQADIASRQILSGQSMVSGDFQIPAQTLSSVTSNAAEKAQLIISPPTGRFRYIALNTRVKPFDNPDVRRALSAVFDRQALRQSFGGPLTGEIPTHWIPPGQPAFDEAGGAKGPGVDFLAKPAGDAALAAEYMKKAGYASGKYDGGKTFTAVSDNADQQRNVAEVAEQQFAKLGFKVKTRYVVRSTMYTKFCQVPDSEPDICPSVGWLKDFADPETLLDPVFNGKNILPVGNSNFALLDDKDVNALIDKAEVVNDPVERVKAWGEVDRKLTGLAPSIPWLWDTQPELQSKNVNGVINQNLAVFDFMYTSIK